MAYTPLQWDKIQSTLPQEDRVPYFEYLKIADPAGYESIISSRFAAKVADDTATQAKPTPIVDEQTKRAAMRAAGDSAVKVPSIYSKGMRIDSAGNYVGYNPEMEGMTSASGSPTAVPTPAQSAAKNVMPSDADVEAEYQAYLAEQKAAQAAAEEAEAKAIVAAEAAKKAEAAAKAAQEAADKAAADAATAAAADKAAADAKAAELAEQAAIAAQLAEATQEAADAAAANADATATLPGAEGTAITGSPVETGTPVVTGDVPNDYEEVGGILTYKGKAYTGAYNGKNYVNGKVVETPGDDIYETLNGVFQLNGKPYTGIYDDKEYKDGVEVKTGSGNYETIGGIFTFNGKAYTGEYDGKKYINGLEQKTPTEDKYAEVNGVFTKNNEPFTGEYGGKKYKNGVLEQEPGEVDGFTTKDGVLYEKGSLYTGEWQGKKYKNGLLVDDTGEPVRPENVNKFFVYNPTTKTWERPAKPQDGATYSWDDNTGWVQETPGADKPAGTPAAYVYDEKTKTWIKPPQLNATDTWDDTKGWVAKVVGTEPGTKPGAAWVLSPDGKSWVKPAQTNPTDTWDNEKGWVAAGTGGTGTGGTGTGTGTGGFTQKDIDAAVAAALANATETTTDKNAKANALASLTARFSRYGLESLIPKIKELVLSGSTEATIALELAETEEYKQRFKANADRLKKGLSVLDPGTYIGMEDSYRQSLRAYGLKQFDTDDYVSQFIANDISANELSNRIVTAVQRVQNADPAITKQLKDFYNIGQNDLVAYVLDPNQQFQKIERQVQAAEIGVAAARQGITAGVQVAEQLAAQGVTQAEAQKGYATIADILPDAKKLSDIYGTTLEGYDLGQAEQEVFNQLASAQRRRQKLSQREIAAFSGSSGTNKSSLTTSAVGQF